MMYLQVSIDEIVYVKIFIIVPKWVEERLCNLYYVTL